MIVPDYIERSKRKTLSLTVLKNGNVIVKAPINMSDEIINNFVEAKQSWIREKLSSIKETQNKFEDVISGEKIMIYGNKYSVLKADIKQIQTSDKFELFVPAKFNKEKQTKAIILWFKKLAKKVLAERLSFVEKRINLKSTSFKIGDSRGRWGSCNSYGNIILNYRVVMLPPAIIDYVIVHELCHLLELNHSKRFWQNVGKFLPNYEIQRKNIKEYGFLLGLY
ncbi:MAG: M48 family metallopeptidase [Clostridia bacterium]|nr:M48 family metallopeptidase [Clostridia bacterium]